MVKSAGHTVKGDEMAHKTRINGTEYEITGGKCLVGGTEYAVQKGRTLVGGTGYDVSFSSPSGFKDIFSGKPSYCGINGIDYGDGYWVACGVRNDANSRASVACIAYTNNLAGEWTVVDIWRSSKSYGAEASSIKYANGYWVISGANDSGAVVAASISPSGPWVTTVLHEWDNDYTLKTSLAYGDGIFAVLTQTRDGTRYISSASNPKAGWSRKSLSSNVKPSEYITYGNGYWILSGKDDGSSGTYGDLFIAYSNYLTGEFKKKVIKEMSQGMSFIESLSFSNGYFFLCTSTRNNQDYKYYATAFYTNSPSSEWSEINNFEIYESWPAALCSLTFADSLWLASAESANGIEALTSQSLSSSWNKKTVWGRSSTASQLSGPASTAIYAGGFYVLAGSYADAKTGWGRIVFAKSFDELPSIVD